LTSLQVQGLNDYLKFYEAHVFHIDVRIGQE